MNRISITTGLMLMTCVFTACSRPTEDERETTGAGNGSTGGSEPTAVPGAGFVYTADERGNSISVIDLSTGQARGVAVRISPHNVQVSRDGSKLFVVGEVMEMTGDGSRAKMNHGGKMERGRLLILDTETLAVEGAVDMEIGHHPAHVIVDGQCRLAYVTNSEDDNVLVVDIALKKVVGEIGTGSSPHGLRMSPDGREIYVANVKDNSVSVIDAGRGLELTRIPVGKAPVQAGFTPDGRRVYVSLRDENSVAVIDTAQRRKIATVAVGRNPIQVFATPDGARVYVANQGTEENPDSTVSVIDTDSNSVIATIETGQGAHGVVISDDGRRAFISNILGGTVSVIDTSTRRVTHSIQVGKGPNGITFRNAK